MFDLIIKKLRSKGEINMPPKLDIVALKIAPGTFPFASETITTEDDTVEGNAATKKTLNQICIFEKTGLISIMSIGNNINVANCITKCIFQFVNPSRIF